MGKSNALDRLVGSGSGTGSVMASGRASAPLPAAATVQHIDSAINAIQQSIDGGTALVVGRIEQLTEAVNNLPRDLGELLHRTEAAASPVTVYPDLLAAVKATNAKPILIDDDHRIRIDTLLGQNIDTQDDLVKFIERLVTIAVTDETGKHVASLVVDAERLDRLDGRRFPDQPMQEFLQETVIESIDRVVGLS